MLQSLFLSTVRFVHSRRVMNRRVEILSGIFSAMIPLGNRPYGVSVPYNYQNLKRWKEWFSDSGLAIQAWKTDIPVFPYPISCLFGRSHNFAALLEKT